MSDWITLSSRAIEKYQYDPTTRDFYVVFNNNPSIYLYIGVENNTFDNFINSSSKGQYFNRNIRGNYSHRVINLR